MENSAYSDQSEAFARECFARQVEFARMIEQETDAPRLYELAVDLGNVLLDIARDPRLEAIVGGEAGDLEARLATVLLVDWAHLLEQFGYQPPPPAEDRADDLRASILRHRREPRGDTYLRLRHYLTDLGNRLVESDPPESPGKDRRLRRRVGRGLWVFGRVTLAALAGAGVGALLGPGAGVMTFAGLAADVGKEVAKAIVETVLPERVGQSDAAEDEELHQRAEQLNDLLSASRLGQFRSNLQLVEVLRSSGTDSSPSMTSDVLLWISMVQGAILALRSLTVASRAGLTWSYDKLSGALVSLREGIRSGASLEFLMSFLTEIETIARDVSEGLAEGGFRRHPEPT